MVTSASGITDLNDVDVALVQDFNALAQALRLVVTQLCSPSLTIQKLAQTRDSAAYVPTPGWTMTVNPVVNLPGNPPYRWILPTANAPIGPKSAITNANGFAQFQWEPNPPTRTSSATVTETNQSGYTPRDWACKAKNPDGSVVETSGAFPAAAPFTFTVTVGPQQIVTCTVRNDFNYAPAGVVTKVNTPTIVRGDGNGTNVTSHYTVTNTGNTPLSPVSGTDTECAPIEYVMAGGEISGDDNGDGLLDPGETWDLQCTRRIQHATTDEDVLIPNTVTLHGRAPNGQDVIGTADAEVQVLTPDIHVEKTVAPTAGVAPLDVTYTYAVTTTGNTPLANVQLERRHAALFDGREPHVRRRGHGQHRIPRSRRDMDLHLRREQPHGQRGQRRHGRRAAGDAGRSADQRSGPHPDRRHGHATTMTPRSPSRRPTSSSSRPRYPPSGSSGHRSSTRSRSRTRRHRPRRWSRRAAATASSTTRSAPP